jgi:hypothetical protein
VQPYSGNDLFRKKGWLKVSDNKRYLTYDNGDPFFYLGDTVWEIVRKSLMSEARQYIADRKSKGFNAVQLVTISCLNLFPNGAVNRYGEAVYLDTNFSMINPRYFDYMDSIVSLANDSGMIVAIVPMWAAMNEQSSFSYYHRKPIPDAETLLMERYVAARYGGNNVLWIVTADDFYDTPKRRKIWTQAAYLLDSAGGGEHLKTIHPGGWTSSIDFFPDEDWLDFHMYQSSHSVDGDYTWYGGNAGYNVQPRKPVLNGECNYEDINNNLISPQQDSNVSRITTSNIRQADYETLFSGAYVGITYGASGAWQWSRPEDMGVMWPRYSWDTAIAFPGSTQMGVFRTLMERYNWYNLIPGQTLITQPIAGREDYLPVAYDTSRILIYFPKFTDFVGINFQMLSKAMRLDWINPATGTTETIQAIVNSDGLGEAIIALRDTNDWLLVATRVTYPDSMVQFPSNNISIPGDLLPHIPSDIFNLFNVEDPIPNPCTGSAAIHYYAPDAGTISLSWWNTQGQCIGESVVAVYQGYGEQRIEGLAPGVYQVRLCFTSADGKRKEWNGRIVSMR